MSAVNRWRVPISANPSQVIFFDLDKAIHRMELVRIRSIGTQDSMDLHFLLLYLGLLLNASEMEY